MTTAAGGRDTPRDPQPARLPARPVLRRPCPPTLGAGGLTQNAAHAQAFIEPVSLSAAQTWTLASGVRALTFGSGVNTTKSPGANHALTINAATTTGAGNVVNGNPGGAGSLTKTGAGNSKARRKRSLASSRRPLCAAWPDRLKEVAARPGNRNIARKRDH